MAVLNITMFGEFSISANGVTLNEQNKRSKNLWMLLEYLITFHDREIAQNELIELLWGEKSSDNPVSALKTQMHRLRALLSDLGCDNIIVSTQGSYAFNNKLDFSIDFERFEALCKKAAVSGVTEDEKLACYIEASEIYKGDFLPKFALESWVVPINTYYRSLYIKCVHSAIDLLYKNNRLNEIVDVCRRAIIIDPYDEPLHYYLIKVFAELGDGNSAKSHYSYVTELFYTKFGVTPSPELMKLYNDAVKTEKNIAPSIDAVTENLSVDGGDEGAFYCEYEFFKHMYQLEIRDAERNRKSINICLITVTDLTGGFPEQKSLNRGMEHLQEIIRVSLRKSDIFARYSVSQYIIMLPNTDENTGEMVMRRIAGNFRKDYPRDGILVNYKFQPLASVMNKTK